MNVIWGIWFEIFNYKQSQTIEHKNNVMGSRDVIRL